MLTIAGAAEQRSSFCDRMPRRNFLKIGALGLGGLSLPQLLAAESRSATGRSKKSVLMVYLVGGPPHQDIVDLKPMAPKEIAGPFKPIATNVPGIEICEHLAQLARRMDRMTVIRSMVGAQDDHNAAQCYTGRHPRNNVPAGGWPQFGSAVSAVEGAHDPAVPPFMSLCYPCTHPPYNEPGPGFLGVGRSPFNVLGDSRQDMVLQGVTPERLGNRRELLAGVDRFRRGWDASGAMDGMDAFTSQALGILTSSKLAQALDVSREDPRTVARYGVGDTTVFIDGNGAPRVPQSFLVARRLLEAGARVVTMNYSKWDWHGHPYGSCFDRCKEDLLVLDPAFTAFLDDLRDRGLEDDVLVLVWGEFGRTPQINGNVGRDHWPRVSCALLAGGGLRHGRAIGATDRLAGEAVDRPVTFPEVFATLYRHLGIDAANTVIQDLQGRPQYLVEDGAQPIAELVL